MYRAINTRSGVRQAKVTTLMANKGVNIRDLPQFLNVDYALNIENYVITAGGGLEKRAGLTKIFEVVGTNAITMLEKFTNDIYIFGYNTTVAAYTISTGVITTIKNNFPTADPFSGVRYGDFFFVCNGSTVIQRINTALTITAVAGSPQAKVLRAIGSRLFAGNLSTDETAVAYSDIDTGSNPPFTNWTVGTLANDPGLVNFRNAGKVNAIEPLGQYTIVFSDFGKWAFYINVMDVGGSIRKNDVFVISRLDFGGARGAITTPDGLYYVNNQGIWRLSSLGQNNIPFSDQENTVTQLLSTKFFTDVDLTNISIIYNGQIRTILVSCAKDSAINNLVIAYNTQFKAISLITGWNINRFMEDNGVFYGGSSNATKVYRLFSGYNDDGKEIWTEYYQELKTGDPDFRQKLSKEYIHGFLSTDTCLKVAFDKYDATGFFLKDVLVFYWRATTNGIYEDGWGKQQFSSGWGGETSITLNPQNLIESFDGSSGRINNYQRLRLKITGHDKLPHKISYFTVITENKVPIRRRTLSTIPCS